MDREYDMGDGDRFIIKNLLLKNKYLSSYLEVLGREIVHQKRIEGI